MAIDNRLIRSVGSPSGIVNAPKGTFYINTQTSGIYVKISGTANTSDGWVGLLSKGYYTYKSDPEGNVYAPRLAYCYEETDNNLYVQLTESDSPEYNGWVSLTNNNLVLLETDPYSASLEGTNGDVCIDESSKSIYAYKDKWQKLTQFETNDSDIMVNLSDLLTNVTEITRLYYNMFINAEPMDLSISQYDDEGNLNTYIVPNRAKDRLAIMGTVNPNGTLDSYVGTLYLDTTTRTLYLKTTTAGINTGWKAIIFEEKVVEPLYVDSNSGNIKIRVDNTITQGSDNMVSSDTLYTLFNNKADKAGSDTTNFKVANPVADKDAVNLAYLKSMFTFDSSAGTLKIKIDGKTYTISSVTSA